MSRKPYGWKIFKKQICSYVCNWPSQPHQNINFGTTWENFKHKCKLLWCLKIIPAKSLNNKYPLPGNGNFLLKQSEWGQAEEMVSVQFNSVSQSRPTLCNPMDCSMPGLPVHHHSQSLLKLMSIEPVMPFNHLILCGPLLFLPSIFPNVRVFYKWVSPSHQVAKVLEFQLQHQPFQWTFRTDLL